MGQCTVKSDAIASGASTSAGVSLDGRSWNFITVVVPSMSTAAALAVQTSVDAGTTFYNVFDVAATSTVQYQFIIASGVGANGGSIGIPGNHRYLRFIATGVVSGGVGFKVICSE